MRRLWLQPPHPPDSLPVDCRYPTARARHPVERLGRHRAGNGAGAAAVAKPLRRPAHPPTGGCPSIERMLDSPVGGGTTAIDHRAMIDPLREVSTRRRTRANATELTERQHEALTIIRRHIQVRGVPPSRSELAKEMGIANPSRRRQAPQRAGEEGLGSSSTHRSNGGSGCCAKAPRCSRRTTSRPSPPARPSWRRADASRSG